MVKTAWFVRRAAVVLAPALASLALTAPAHAGTVSSTPGSSWGVYKACPKKYAKQNCGAIYAIAHVGSRVYIAGNFTSLVDPSGSHAPLAYTNLAALDAGTGRPVTSFRSHTFNRSVLSLATSSDGSRVFAGGSFSTIDGASAAHVVALNASTGSRLSFGSGTNGTVRALLAAYGKLYVGGDFTSVHGSTRYRAAALDPATGSLLSGFAPRPTAADGATQVRSFAAGVAGDGHPRLYVAGHFDTVSGSSHRSIAAVDPSSGRVDNSFNARVEHTLNDPLQAGDEVIAVPAAAGRPAGVLLAQSGHSNRAYRYNLDGSRVWRWAPDGDVQTVAVSGTTVYFGGHFVCAANCRDDDPSNDVTRIHVAALNYGNGSIDTSWAPALGPSYAPYFFGVWALRMVGNDLWAGGVFNQVTSHGTTYRRPKVAVFRG